MRPRHEKRGGVLFIDAFNNKSSGNDWDMDMVRNGIIRGPLKVTSWLTGNSNRKTSKLRTACHTHAVSGNMCNFIDHVVPEFR